MADGGTGRWRDVARLTLLGTAAAIGISLLLTYLLFFSEALGAFGRSMAVALVLPVLIAAPLFAFIGLRLQELRQQRQQLNRLATYDETTGFMTGTALATVVDRRMASTDPDQARAGFLVVRLDNLLDINIEHGFEQGNEALRLVAGAIRGSVRESDTVGRLGPGEFGVFLPGASEANAREVGERIRAEIEKTSFAPGGTETQLAVSTGGVVFEQDFGFGDMFRSAESQLGLSKGGLALARAGERRAGTTRH